MRDLGDWLLLKGSRENSRILVRKSEIKTAYRNEIDNRVVLNTNDGLYQVEEDFDKIVEALTGSKMLIADPSKWSTDFQLKTGYDWG